MKKFSFDGYCLAHIKVNSILREKRLVLGLTQQQVADKAKINYRQYQKFESGYNWSVEMEKVGHKMENPSDFIKNFPF